VLISYYIIIVALFIVIVLDSLLIDYLRYKARNRDIRVVSILAIITIYNSNVSFSFSSSSSSSSSFITFFLIYSSISSR
jgi:lipoprotein signal peptidase